MEETARTEGSGPCAFVRKPVIACWSVLSPLTPFGLDSDLMLEELVEDCIAANCFARE